MSVLPPPPNRPTPVKIATPQPTPSSYTSFQGNIYAAAPSPTPRCPHAPQEENFTSRRAKNTPPPPL